MNSYRYALPSNERIADRYRIQEVLGEGGFSITYRAWDERLKRPVVIKEYLPGEMGVRDRDTLRVAPKEEREDDLRYGLEKFLEEAVALAGFKHPNIVPVLDYFEANGTAYLVMTHEEGETLPDYLRGHGSPLGEEEILDLLIPLLRGLEEVHRAGLLHRDIKPENIFLRKTGGPMLIDFGAARHALGERSRSLSVIISKGYSSPEQYSTRGKQGPATDLYSLGAVLYGLITGKTPVEAVVRSHQHSEGEPDPLVPAAEAGQGKVSAWLLELTGRLLSIPFKDRPQSCAEVLQAIDAGRDGLPWPQQAIPGPAQGPAPARETQMVDDPERFRKVQEATKDWWRQGPVLLVTVAAVALMALGVAVFLTGRGDSRLEFIDQGQFQQGFDQLPETTTEDVQEPPAPSPGQGPSEGAAAPSARPSREETPASRMRESRTGMEFAPIKGGCFQMGSPETEAGRDKDEKQHQVCVEDFAMGKYEVKVGEFRRFVEATGYRTDAETETETETGEGGVKGCVAVTSKGSFGIASKMDWRNPSGYQQEDDHPVVCVSWNDAMAFAAWLSRETGKNFRLPTEAEWEYAARSGTTTARWWGEDPDEACRYANVMDQAAKRNWPKMDHPHNCNDGYTRTAPAGRFEPSPFGLHDILGNVWEWTCSAYEEDYSGKETRCAGSEETEDGQARQRSFRGGAWWWSLLADVRSASRGGTGPVVRSTFLGFRLVHIPN